ncbi:hypothetical protein AB2S62_07950 [Vibrio sp. NTOU-M3]|uniref:hypothetical protein n=1 Tax=Vibrio sp. NTOU-M3 TaxID=3234954 RepID=UPI00349F4A79
MKSKLLGFLAMTTLLSGCIAFTDSTKENRYPSLSDATYSKEELTVKETNNVLRSAIVNNRLVSLTATDMINQSMPVVFAEAYDDSSKIALESQEFHRSLEELVKEFSCQLYASRQPTHTIQLCPASNQVVLNNLNYLPFTEGVWLTQRLSNYYESSQQPHMFELYLKSGIEKPLTSVWGAVHEAGYFPASEVNPRDLVLTIFLDSYNKTESQQPWQRLYREPLVFFVFLPPVDHILDHQNEVKAMDFAYNNARLLLVDSR